MSRAPSRRCCARIAAALGVRVTSSMVEITIVLTPSVSRVSLAATRQVRAGADGWRLRR
jgi:hypothetical protein